MKIIAKSTLRKFWESSPEYTDAKTGMTEWYNYSLNAQWSTPHKIKENLRSASILKNNRVVLISVEINTVLLLELIINSK